MKQKAKIIQAVSVVFIYQDQIFSIVRQNHLKFFPGYTSFPGGKVDRDERISEDLKLFEGIDFNEGVLFSALIREIQEELSFDVVEYLKNYNQKIDENICCKLGIALSPPFVPVQFENHVFRIVLKAKPNFKIDPNELASGAWQAPREIVGEYCKGLRLFVPPVIKLIRYLCEDLYRKNTPEISALGESFDNNTEVPMLEHMVGIKRITPLSNTLPPADRTNAFLIGDILVDPSPIDENELTKLFKTLKPLIYNKILITHHHRDHHQFSVDIARMKKKPMVMHSKTQKRLLEKMGEDYLDGVRVEFVKEGDIVTKWIKKDIHVYEVPGHDDGQMALAPQTMEWFLVGDILQEHGTVVIPPKEGDMDDYYNTLERIIKLNPKVIIPSHGIFFGGVNRLIDALEHRKKREQQIVKLLNDGYSEEKICEMIYKFVNPKLRKYAMHNVKSHVMRLKKHNLV